MIFLIFLHFFLFLSVFPCYKFQKCSLQVLVIKQQPTASYSPEITAPVKPETQARSENSYTPASTVPVATVSNPGVSSSRGPSLLSQRGVNKLSLNLNLVCSISISFSLIL